MDGMAKFDSSIAPAPAFPKAAMREPPPDSDGEAMRRWVAGDRGAFEGIVRRWEGPVGRFLARLTGDGEEASDLLQEVFLRVYLKGAAYRDVGHFRTWLYQIALNLARDAARRKVRKPAVALTEMHDPPCAAEPPDDGERAALVSAALAELPAAQREVVVLRHYEDLTFEAMARLLGVPATTLKSRFGVAMAKLEQALRARGMTPENAP